MSIEIKRSGIEVRDASESDLEQWNRHVERSPHGNPFHQYESLETLAKHSGSKLHPLVGFKGQEPVGIFPLFTISKGPVTTVFSPPPNLLVPYLGPALLNANHLKQRKAERRHRRFINGCLDWVDAEFNNKYMHVRTDGRYTDHRPFKWAEFDLHPSYTYVVDLRDGKKEVMMNFSSDARNNIRSSEDANYTVKVGGPDAIEQIINQVQARYDAQNESYGIDPSFVIDLYHALPDGQVRPYVCSVDGSFLGGMVAVEFDDTIYRWQGGAKTNVDLPVNDLVDWAIIRDAIDRGIETYDLVGANKERLCEYKAKFGPTLRTYHSLERGTRSMSVVSDLYRTFL